LSLCNHPNIVTLHEFFLSDQYVSLILNQVKGRQLFSAIQNLEKDYTSNLALSIIFQVAKAVKHCRLNGIIWCNLSHENIIYDGQNITCLNFSEVVLPKNKKLMNIFKKTKGIIGNLNYSSPEMLSNKHLTYKHDVWSLGVLSFYLLAGEFPFEANSDVETIEHIIKDEPKWELLEKREVSKKIIKIIKKMLKKNDTERISIDKLIKHSIFNIIKEQDSQVIYKLLEENPIIF
jgi:serine/threonine protein kinase